jgi:transformation/transcription domain-associated protein
MIDCTFPKRDDITGKQEVHLDSLTHLTFPKITIQVYMGLLKAHQLEAKALARHAMDIIALVLPRRIINHADLPRNLTYM